MAATGIVLLAAGASARLGSPKQNLLFRGQALLEHAVQAALQSGAKPMVVVLGAQANNLKSQVNFPEMKVVENPEWEEGMGASIRYGVAALIEMDPALTGIILMVCDQPFVTGEFLQKLIAEKEVSHKNIIACSYQDTLGTPVLFGKKFFPDLLTLRGAHGAKKLVYHYPEEVAALAFELASFDIDTLADYNTLQNYVAGEDVDLQKEKP